MRLVANLTWPFTEAPFLDRLGLAAAVGFDTVEVLFPYGTDPRALCDVLAAADLPLVLINTPLPPGGECGFAAMPGREEDFRQNFVRAARYARAVGVPRIHVMSGTATGARARTTLVGNLCWALHEAPDLAATVKPLSPGDALGYFLNDFRLAESIVREVGNPRFGLQFDADHAEVIHGGALAAWRETGGHASHVRIVGAPTRNEPDRGAMDLDGFFRLLGASGYTGCVAAKYRPGGETGDSLGWIRTARRALDEGPEERP